MLRKSAISFALFVAKRDDSRTTTFSGSPNANFAKFEHLKHQMICEGDVNGEEFLSPIIKRGSLKSWFDIKSESSIKESIS